MQYTTALVDVVCLATLFYQDFKDTFVCNTQQSVVLFLLVLCCFIRISKILLYAIHNPFRCICSFVRVVLSGFQRYFCMQYTTGINQNLEKGLLFYQDFKDTFVCNTQPSDIRKQGSRCCFIRISKILLYAIHNAERAPSTALLVVLSGFQRYFCMQYTTLDVQSEFDSLLFYQDFKDTFVCNTQRNQKVCQTNFSCFIRISKILLYAIHNYDSRYIFV